MSTDSISPIPFYCTPFEKQVILYFTAKLLEESVKLRDKLDPSKVRDILTDAKDLFLNEMSLPILNKELFLLSKEESNEEIKNEKDEEKLSDLVFDKYNEIKNYFDKINCSIFIKAEIEDKPIEEMPEKLVDELKYLLLYKKISSTVALTLTSNSSNPEVISFFDSIISCLTVKCFREVLQTKKIELSYIHYNHSYDYRNTFWVINFLQLFSKKDLVELIKKLRDKNFPKDLLVSIEFQDLPPMWYVVKNNYFGSLSRDLREVYRSLTFGFGFVEKLKVCQCKRGYIEKNVVKCKYDSKDLKCSENVFIISKNLYDTIEDDEKFGIILEQYVYLNIRKSFVMNQLNFIISRNITINQNELDIICIPVGSLFRKMLIIECKTTCEDNDINKFKNKINGIFNRNMGDTYLASSILRK